MPDLRVLFFVLLAALAASPLSAQLAPEDPFGESFPDPVDELPDTPSAGGPDPDPASSDTAPSAEKLLTRSDETRRAAAAVKAALGEKPLERPNAESPLRIVTDETYLGFAGGRQGTRFLAARLWLVNSGREPVTVAREAFRLSTRGRELLPGGKPDQPVPSRFPLAGRLIDLSEFDQEGPLTIQPGAAVAVSVLFLDLPGASDVPPMTLRLPVGDISTEIDLNEDALGRLKPSIERIGPKGLLGLVTIAGEITPVGTGSLVEILEKLAAGQTSRVVINWSAGAPIVPPDISNWLVQSASRMTGAPLNDRRHPSLSGSLRDLHLARFPDGTGVPNLAGPKRVHASVPEAVTAALAGAYESLPADELVREIETGHPLTRPAAVAAGGRLPEDKLPLLLTLTGDDDSELAKAAVRALREFGAPHAIARLAELAKVGSEPVRFAAVESLAASRFSAAHEALRVLLDASADGPPVIPPAALVPVLARYPRPLWGDALYRLATTGEPAVRSEALQALAKLGHPDLAAAFRAALDDEDERLRTTAFRSLARRRDAASEDLAIRFTLHHLESAPPTREMSGLIQRTKDPRAVPLLLKQLGEGGPNASELIRLLSQIGGLEVRDAMEAAFPKLERPVQPMTLSALAQMRSPKFYEFAGAALRSNDAALINTASQQLQADGGAEAVKLLAEALSEGTQPVILSNVSTALAGIGTPEARAALKKAIRSEEENRVRFAHSAWNQLASQSPGRDSYNEASAAARRDDWKQAVEKYSEVVELDPQFVEAWSGRANAYLQLGDRAAARDDYERTLALDPGDPVAVACLGILRAYEGRVDEGLTFVRERSAGFEKDNGFAYNLACLYGVASDQVEATDPARAERLRVDAIKEVARAVSLGMTDPKEVDWMKKDPDLKSLRDRDDFKKVVAEAEKRAAEAVKQSGDR